MATTEGAAAAQEPEREHRDEVKQEAEKPMPVGDEQGKQEQAEVEVAEHGHGGELLYCGTTSWDTVGRSKQPDSPNIVAPTRLALLKGVSIAFVASGSSSTHCVAVGADGRCFTWGRNEKGQLGHGDLNNRVAPEPVQALAEHKIVRAGAGRQHTVVITDSGLSLAFGFNKHGQLGCGHNKDEIEQLPVKCLIEEAKHAVCGADFTVWLTSVEGATILTAGLPQYGQLGHGTDNQYNMKEGSVKIAYEAQSKPLAISAFAGKTITKAACGHNHTVAADSDGFVYTWGYGGHGRLGHKEQKDEFTPRMLEIFQKQNVLPPTAVVAAGAAFSACTAGAGQLYMWGRVRPTGDNWMYPKPVSEFSDEELKIHSMDCGNTTTVVATDTSCISWGTAASGELGYGVAGPKSSSNPKIIPSLEGVPVKAVACGFAHTLLVASKCDKLEELEVYDASNSPAENEESEAEGEEGEEETGSREGNKRGAPSSGRGGRPARKRAKKKYSSEEEEEEEEEDDEEAAEESPDDEDFGSEDDSEDSEDDYMSSEDDSPPRRGRGRGRGTPRGRGRGRRSS